MIEIKDLLIADNEGRVENILRPKSFETFVGQKKVVGNLRIFIEAAKKRNSALDHVLFYGPPGLGKTTLASMIARDMRSNLRVVIAPTITKTGDLAAILSNLKDKDILFIDEIHRLSATIEEMLYSALEDFKLDIVVGEGHSARVVKIDLSRFTLIGATTRYGLLSNPLKDRLGITLQLEFYEPEELALIVQNVGDLLGIKISKAASLIVGQRSRGTPRIAINLTKRIIDISEIEFKIRKKEEISPENALKALTMLGINQLGLDKLDLKYIDFLYNKSGNRPTGIETLAAALAIDRETLEDFVEPYLLQQGYINKTPRGRILTEYYIKNHLQS